ncbi:hypothetical protein [Parablautia intestinalis]|nr:hypothetical protein [Parablautia intestinalis]
MLQSELCKRWKIRKRVGDERIEMNSSHDAMIHEERFTECENGLGGE